MGTNSPVGGGAVKRFPPWLGTVFVYVLSLGCLLWVYHDFELASGTA
ncbi:MAG: hypothetical protein QM757_22075 [Paludibaculum sp.]